MDLEFIPASRLSPSRRVRRGFTRIGFVLAVLAASAGLILTAFLSIEGAKNEHSREVTLGCLKVQDSRGQIRFDSYSPDRVDVDASGCTGYAYVTLQEVRAHTLNLGVYWSSLLNSSLFGLLATLAAALLSFALPWSIGWVIAGFFRD